MIQSESVDRRVEVVCPKSRVAVALSRFARETMTSKIQRDESVAGGQVRVELTVPGEPALRKAMDEQNRAACRVARLDQVERVPPPPVIVWGFIGSSLWPAIAADGRRPSKLYAPR